MQGSLLCILLTMLGEALLQSNNNNNNENAKDVSSLYQSIELQPEAPFYAINQSVTILCRMKHVKSLMHLFFRGEDMQAEYCRIFEKKGRDLKCYNRTIDGVLISHFALHIRKLSWADRGKWACQGAFKKVSTTINVYVSPAVKPLAVKQVKPLLEPNSVPKVASASVLGSGPSPQGLQGRGSRTNPYNLRDGSALNVSCRSSCAFPPAQHSWTSSNATNIGRVLSASALGGQEGALRSPMMDQSDSALPPQAGQRNESCTEQPTTGMAHTTSFLLVNCSRMQLIGANEIVCRSSAMGQEDQNAAAGGYSDGLASVYVLCPGGNRPWELTNGEVVGLILSAGIIVLMAGLLSMLLRRSKAQQQQHQQLHAQQLVLLPGGGEGGTSATGTGLGDDTTTIIASAGPQLSPPSQYAVSGVRV